MNKVVIVGARGGRTTALTAAIMAAHEAGQNVLVCKTDGCKSAQEYLDELMKQRRDVSNILYATAATPPDISPTPFTKSTPRQRANKGAKWYDGVRKGRREW